MEGIGLIIWWNLITRVNNYLDFVYKVKVLLCEEKKIYFKKKIKNFSNDFFQMFRLKKTATQFILSIFYFIFKIFLEINDCKKCEFITSWSLSR